MDSDVSALVASLGRLLRLPQTAIATAQAILARFWHLSSDCEYPAKDIALGAIFLAAKVEECGRSIRDIVNVYFAIQLYNTSGKSQPAFVDVPYEAYEEYKDAIIRTEICILARLGFNVHVQHPHGFMINYLQSLGLANNKELAQFCWNCLNDLGSTDVIVHYQPNVVACAAIYYGAYRYGESLPSSPPWWELFDSSLTDIENICKRLSVLYKGKIKA